VGGITSTGGLSTSQGGVGGSYVDGGAPGSGGQTGAGGVVSSGGATSTGGANSGGTSGTGGTSSTGGSNGNTCGGLAAIHCPGEKQFCDLTSDCGRIADATGTCEVIGDTCPSLVAPVCGCDGTTYQNNCERIKAGVLKASSGSCPVDAGN
jgi:hypothetical protein